jgi:hypothetical protein
MYLLTNPGLRHSTFHLFHSDPQLCLSSVLIFGLDILTVNSFNSYPIAIVYAQELAFEHTVLIAVPDSLVYQHSY